MKNRIDVHTHYLPPAYYELLRKRELHVLDGGMAIPEWSAEKQLQNMEALSVDYAYLSISSPHLNFGDHAEAADAARACNEYGTDLMRKNPDKLAVMASLPLPGIEESLEEVRYCSQVLGIDRFCLMTNSCGVYLGDPILDPVMEELNKAHAIVGIHPTEPSSVPESCCEDLPFPLMEFFFDTSRAVVNMILHRIFQRYPDIRFIVPHAGAFLPVLSDRLAGVPAVVPKLKDVDFSNSLHGLYYDLAGVVMPKQFGILKQITDIDHLLYGSDSTFTPLPLCVKLAQEMDDGLTKEESQRIYRDNAKVLFE